MPKIKIDSEPILTKDPCVGCTRAARPQCQYTCWNYTIWARQHGGERAYREYMNDSVKAGRR